MEALSGLGIYGPLGLWCLAATLGVVSLYRDNGKLRDLHTAAVTKATTDHATAIEAQHTAFVDRLDEIAAQATSAATAFAAQVKDLSAAHATALQSQADRYERQMSEMQQRTFTIVGTLTDKMAALADSITRALAAR